MTCLSRNLRLGLLSAAELDLDDNSLRFYLNGRDQGVAFRVRHSSLARLLLAGCQRRMRCLSTPVP